MAIHSSLDIPQRISISPPIARWRFSPQGEKTQEVHEIPIVPPNPLHEEVSKQSFVYCVEKSTSHAYVVRRYSKEWKVTKTKDRFACWTKRRSPFDCYVEELLDRWSSIGIRVSPKDRQRAEETPYRPLSKTKIEVFTDFPVTSWPLEEVEGLSDEFLLKSFFTKSVL